MKTKSKGAFVQLPNGTWAIDTKVKVNNEFKHFKKTGYPTLSAAKADFERAKAEFISTKSLSACEVMIFEDLLKEYKKMRRITVNVTTLGCDKSIYNVNLLPFFKGMLIKDVFSKESIVEWYNTLIDDENVSNNKKSKAITRVKDILKFAYQHKYIDAITYQDCDVELYQVKVDKKPKKERVVWSEEEENKFFEVVSKNKKDFVLFKTFFSVAARLGEFLALKSSSFDYEKRKIMITQQTVRIEGKGVVVTDKLKTSESNRSVRISQQVADLLKEYIDTFGIKENDFLFTELTKSLPMGRTTFRRKLSKYCAMAGVREINPHAVRHLMAVKLSRVADNAEMIEAAASFLGHTPEMFMNTYAKHSKEENQNTLLERLGF